MRTRAKDAGLVWRLRLLQKDGFFSSLIHIPAPFAFLAIVAEFFGGLGLILGLLTRVAAFGIAVNMLVAVLMVHIRFGFFANWAGNQKGEGIEYDS